MLSHYCTITIVPLHLSVFATQRRAWQVKGWEEACCIRGHQDISGICSVISHCYEASSFDNGSTKLYAYHSGYI
jgi:hypothetical protein